MQLNWTYFICFTDSTSLTMIYGSRFLLLRDRDLIVIEVWIWSFNLLVLLGLFNPNNTQKIKWDGMIYCFIAPYVFGREYEWSNTQIKGIINQIIWSLKLCNFIFVDVWTYFYRFFELVDFISETLYTCLLLSKFFWILWK